MSSRRPDMITTSTPARSQASSARGLAHEKFPSASREQGPELAEQGAVEIGVDAAQGHGVLRSRDVRLATLRPHPDVPAAARRPGSSTSPPTRSTRAPQRHARSGRSPTGCARRGGLRHARRRRRRRPQRPAGRAAGRDRAARPGDRGPRRRVGRAGPRRHLLRRGRGGARSPPARRPSTTSRAAPTRDARARRRARLRLRADAHRGAASGRPPGARATTTSSST